MSRRGIASLVFGQWLKYGLQLVAFVALSRLLDPKDFGLMAVAMAIGGIATVLGDFGLSLSALRSQNLSQSEKSNLFWMNTALGSIVSLVVVGTAIPAEQLTGLADLSGTIAFLSIAFLLNGISVQFRVEINRRKAFTSLAAIDVSAQFVAVFGAIGIAIWGGGVTALIAQTLTYSASVLILSVILARWRPGAYDRCTPIRSHLEFGAFTSVAQILNYAAVNIAPILVNAAGGPTQAGFYNRASQLAVLPVQQVAAPLTRVALPQLASAIEADHFKVSFAAWHRNISYVLLAILSFVSAVATPLLTIAIGPEWAPAASYVQVLAIGSSFQAIGYAFYWGSLARGLSRQLFFAELPGRLVAIALAIAAMPLGPLAVAGAGSLGAAVVWFTQCVTLPNKLQVGRTPIFISSMRALAVFAWAGAIGFAFSQTFADTLPISIALAFVGWTLGVVSSCTSRAVRHDLKAVFEMVFRKS